MFFTNAHCATLFAFAMTCRATGLHCPGNLRAAQCELQLPLQIVNRLHHALFAFKLAAFHEQVAVGQIAFLQSVEDVARHCVRGGSGGRRRSVFSSRAPHCPLPSAEERAEMTAIDRKLDAIAAKLKR
jgi:hypothetical protein